MAEAIRRECDPIAFSLGFRHPHKGDWNRWLTTRRNVYVRWRGPDYDEIVLRWARYGEAWFGMSFKTSLVELPYARGLAARQVRGGLARAWTGFFAPICRDKFGPWRSIAATTAVANACIGEIDAFCREGSRGPHIYASTDARRVTPDEGWIHPLYGTWGDPDLDPEGDDDLADRN